MAETRENGAYEFGDMVKVVDEQGNDLPPVPKAWTSKENRETFLPPGVKVKQGKVTEDDDPGDGTVDAAPVTEQPEK